MSGAAGQACFAGRIPDFHVLALPDFAHVKHHFGLREAVAVDEKRKCRP